MQTRTTFLAPPAAIALLGDTISVEVISRLAKSDARFGQLESDLGTRPKQLATRLKRLQEDGLLTRVAYPEIPPRVVYGLTEKGRELATILQGISEWDASWRCKPA